MTTSVESGQGDSPDELEDGELPDSDDEADKADASVEASKPFSQGPALGTKRPFETIWGGHNSSSKRSKEESGDEDGEIISDDEMDEEEYSYHGNNMAENTSPPAFEHGRYSYPMQANMFDNQFRKSTPNSTTAAAKPAHPATSRNQTGRHSNGTADNTSPSGRSHGTRFQQQSSKREHKSRGGGSKHTALPHPTDPFWGTFKTLLTTPDVPPITGVDLELGYPPLPDELAKEYGLDYYQVFVRDENCGKQQQQQRSQQQRQQKQQQPLHQTRPVEAVKQGDSTFLNSTPTSIAFTTPHSGMEMTMVNAPSNENPNHHQGISGTANSAHTDPLNEAFPLIDQGEESEPSLQDLVLGTDHDKVEEEKKESLKKAVSLKKKLKGVEWHRRQNEREKQMKVVKSAQPCKFYIHGSCRAGEECPYSHDVAKEKRREICKYFMTDSCTKGDDCTYYHGPIPCKYHHSSTGCYRGSQCRFSHEPLTEVTTEILQQLLALKAEKRKQQQPQAGPQPTGGGGGFPPPGPLDHGVPRPMKQGLLPTPTQPPLSQMGILGDTPVPFPPQASVQPIVPFPYADTAHEGAAPQFGHQDDPSQSFTAITDPRTMRAKQSDYPSQYSNDNHMHPLLQQHQAPLPTTEPPPLFLTNPPPLFPQHAHTGQADPRASSHAAATQPSKQPFYQDGHPVESLAVAGETSSKPSTPDERQSKHAKYAHLKVKSRHETSTGVPASSQVSEEVGLPAGVTTEHRTKRPPFQMPESLYNPSILSKPLDPRSLFGSVGEEDGSLPFSSQSSGGDSQGYGQITMTATSQGSLRSDPPTSSVEEGSDLSESATGGSAVVDDKKKGNDATALPYYAMFDTGLGGDDLEIDSAFGELA